MRIAGVQAAPMWLDRKGTLALVGDRIVEAASNGADLVAFPETFVPGYPAWTDHDGAAAWDQPQKEAFAWYLDQAVDVNGDEFGQVVSTARDNNVFAYVGVAERAVSGGSVYCTVVGIDPDDGIVSVHRKLKPTHGERLVWADGDGNGLVVHDFRGWRISALNCWENWMPLARTAMYAQGTQLHIATWPGGPHLTKNISRFIAREGRMYVLSVGGLLNAENIPADFPLRDSMIEAGFDWQSGGSMVVGPDGKTIEGPVVDTDTIVYADVDRARVLEERHNFDPTGHYSRPDVFSLTVDRSRLSALD